MRGETNPSGEKSRIRNITLAGIGVNLLLSMAKFASGIQGSSQAVVADAVHSLSDMSTDLALLFGLRYWSAPADEDHPYGHGRIETLVTALIGLVLLYLGLTLGFKAISTIRDIGSRPPGLIAMVGLLLTVILKEGLYRWTVAVARKVRSKALLANAWHHRSDVLSSLPALLAVGVAYFAPGWSYVDNIGALVVSLFILRVSWKILRPAVAELSDQGATRAEKERIRGIALGIDGVRTVHAIRTRKLGYGLYIDLHIQVNGAMTVHEGHDISERVKSRLIERGPEVADVLVHLEPYNTENSH